MWLCCCIIINHTLKKLPNSCMHRIVKILPFLTWISQLKSKKIIKADLIAGITVALVLVPQSMAYAQLAGLPAQYGLYASFLPVMIAALMGSSRQLSTGPVAVVSLLTAIALQPYALNSETYVAYAFLLAFLIGIFQLLLGFLKLGFVVNFLSRPVVIGFTNATAIIIGASQIEKIFGVARHEAGTTYEQVWGVLMSITQNFHYPSLLMTIVAIFILIVAKLYIPKFPGVLIAVIITTTLSWLIGFGLPVESNGLGGAIVGNIPSGLPSFTIPNFDPNVISQLLITAITISLIGFIEAISIAKVMAAQTKQRLNTNQELIGQGLANITSSFFQGYAVSGSFSRSAVNISAGAITGLSSVITAIIVGVTLLWLTPLLYHLPQAVLAVIIIMAVINLIKFAPIVHAWKVEKHDAIVAVVTFVLTLISAPHLEEGIFVGVILSLGLFLFRTMKPRFTELSTHGAYNMPTKNDEHGNEVISIVKYSGSLYFVNAGHFEDNILRIIADKKKYLKYIIIDMIGINQIDASGENILSELLDRCSANNVEILFARAENVERTLRRSGFIKKYGEERFYTRRIDALNFAWQQIISKIPTLPNNKAQTPPSGETQTPQPKEAQTPQPKEAQTPQPKEAQTPPPSEETQTPPPKEAQTPPSEETQTPPPSEETQTPQPKEAQTPPPSEKAQTPQPKEAQTPPPSEETQTPQPKEAQTPPPSEETQTPQPKEAQTPPPSEETQTPQPEKTQTPPKKLQD